MPVIDLSHTLMNHMPVFPGTEVPRFKTTGSIEKDGYVEKMLTMLSHTGTHMDAPAHMMEQGATLDTFALDKFMGPAMVLDGTGLSGIDTHHLIRQEEQIARCDFIIFQTGWSKYWGQDRYYSGFPVLTSNAARWLTQFNLKGVGVDTISIDAADSVIFPVHKILLPENILIIENLTNLDKVKNGLFTFCCFPLKIEQADGSPIRAVGIWDE